MTTNVFDRVNGMLATDSRWSQQQGRWLVYVDDANCHKIEVAANTAFMFAGRGYLIQQWKDWIRAGADPHGIPGFDGLCICAVSIDTQELKICEGLSIVREDAAFGGSGAKFACPCWETNRDTPKSVETAKALDPATGGETKFFKLPTREHNLSLGPGKESTIADVDRAILTRGIVMDIGNMGSAVPFRLSELAASNDEVRELKAKIEAGELSADAPSDAMYSQWTDEQKLRVTQALGNIFSWQP